MNIFDIVGPIMIGPSSSHTAGAARIGRMAREILGQAPSAVHIYFHGSFAQTYKGHGSDKAVIGGLLDYMPDDGRIKDSLEAAKKKGINFSFEKTELRDAHPNTIVIEAESETGKKISLQGASVGGGNILIQKLNNIVVEFDGSYDTLIIEHMDAPGAIANVTNCLAIKNINIANMKVFRSQKGGLALMIIEADGNLNQDLAQTILEFDSVTDAKYIKKLS